MRSLDNSSRPVKVSEVRGKTGGSVTVGTVPPEPAVIQ